MQHALSGLQVARETAAREFEAAQKQFESTQLKLGQLDQAIARLQETILVVDKDQLPRRQEYAGLGIVEAAQRWLKEVGEAQDTKAIADALLSRGVKTRSKRYVPTVYATLTNSKAFKRVGDKWELKEKRS